MSSDEESVVNQYISDDEDVAVAKKKRRGKKNKDPNRPKRNQSAFFLYSNANRARIKEENPGIAFGEVAKLMSEEFKNLSAAERAKYDRLAEADKQRYMQQMENYDAPEDDSDDDKPSKKKKAKKDPNAPKRPMSAYFLYSNAIRETVKQENPEAKFGDIAKIISAQYKELSESELAGWQKKADADKARYHAEMEEYQG